LEVNIVPDHVRQFLRPRIGVYVLQFLLHLKIITN
jgi:hypothetical protein